MHPKLGDIWELLEESFKNSLKNFLTPLINSFPSSEALGVESPRVFFQKNVLSISDCYTQQGVETSTLHITMLSKSIISFDHHVLVKMSKANRITFTKTRELVFLNSSCISQFRLL